MCQTVVDAFVIADFVFSSLGTSMCAGPTELKSLSRLRGVCNVGNSSSTSTTMATCSFVDMTPVKRIKKKTNNISHPIVFFIRSAWLCLWRRVM